MIRSTVLDVFRAYRRQWWRFLLIEALVAVAVAAVVALLAVLAQLGFLATGGANTTAAGYLRPGALFVASAFITVAFALTGLPALLASITAVVSITDDSLSGRRVRLFRSLAIGFASAYRMTWTVLFSIVSVGLLFVVSPAILVLGVLGLVVTPLARVVGRRFPRAAARWPSVRSLLWCVVPFGVAFRRLAQALLAVPAVILESVGPIGANRAATAAVRSRRLLVLLGAFAGLLVSVVLTMGGLSLGGLIGGASGGQVAVGLAELLTLGLPIVVLTVIYRRIAGERERPLNPQRFVRRQRETSIAWPSWVRRTATIMPGVLVLTGLSVIPLSVSSASAATPSVSAAYVVNTAADDVDATTLAAEQQNCATGSGDCTFRAALAEAQATAGADADSSDGSIAITFSKSMTIALDPSAPPTFALTDSTSTGTLTIDGRGHNVVIDGQGAVQGLALSSAFWGFDLRGLELDNGYAPSGAGHLSQGGALHLLVEDSSTKSLLDGLTFSGNKAVGGGALFSNATATVQNSTFLHNALLANDGVVHSAGADIAASGDMTATNDTFSNSTGATLYGSGAGAFVLTNALMDENDIHTNRCTGIASGSHNIISTDDFTCPGGASSTNVFGTKSMLDTLVTPDGYPSVFPLLVSADDPALGFGTDCPATDERGFARSATSCDAGAYELDRNTSVTLASTKNPASVATSVTFTATLSSTAGSGSVSGGSVRFSVDGTPVGSAVQVTDGAAQYSASNLSVGTHAVIAVYTPANGGVYTPATSAALQQEVDKATGPVGISANATRSILGDAVTFTFSAGDSVTPATGTFDLRDVTDGAPGDVVASDVAFASDGTASVDVDSLATGVHKLEATYSGDAQNAAGTSGSVTITVVAPTTTTLDLDTTSIAYGTPVVATAHVAGTTSAHPSGDVDFTYGAAGHQKAVSAKVDADGNATATISDIPVGSPTVTAVYESTGSYEGSSSAPTTVAVTAASTSTGLSTGQIGDLGYGVPVTLTATVITTATGSTADPSGDVTFSLGGSTIGTGTLVGNENGTSTATYTTTLGQLPLGTARLSATYSADSSFIDSASATVSRSVVAASTTVTVVSDDADASVGQNVQLSATVAATGSAAVPTGSVEFTDGAASLGTVALVNGVATLGIASLARGSHTITATYAGTTTSVGSSDIFVQKISRATTTTTLAASSTSINFGQSVDLDVTVTASGGTSPDGTVSVTDGSGSVATLLVTAGVAHGTLTALSAGSHDLTATFVASEDYAASSDTADVAVHAAATTISLQQSAASVVYGDELVLTATVKNSTNSGATPAGSVEFLVEGKVVATVPVKAGSMVGAATASLTTSDIGVSSDVLLTATFVPSPDFVDSRSDAYHLTVTAAATSTTLTLSAGTTTSTVTATATVVATTGQGVPTGNVRFDYPTGKFDFAALVDGVATFPMRLPRGFDNVTATYLPDSSNFAAGDAATRSVQVDAGAPDVTLADDAMGSIVYGTSDTLTALVAANSAGPTPTGDVSFTAYGPSSAATVLGTVAITPFGATGYGYAARGQLTTKTIPAGTARIVATYQGDANYGLGASPDLIRTVSTASTTSSVTSSLGEPAWVAADSYYYVTLSTLSGAAPTGTVTLTVDGVIRGTKAAADGETAFDAGSESLGTHHVVATFTPANANFAASSAVLDHVVVRLPTTLELNALPAVVGVGEPIPLVVTLAPPSGFATYTTAPAGGYVVVTENGSPVCSINLNPGGPVTGDETGTCVVSYAHVGTHTFVATYSGGYDYQASVSRDTLAIVQKKAATATLTSPSGDWIGGNSVRLNWNVVGPQTNDAPVVITYGDAVVCTSTAVTGSCDYAFPANATGNASFSLAYAGDSDWSSASASLSRSVTGCISATAPTVDLAAAGTAVLETPPNCYAGQNLGYLVGTTVTYVAKANDGYHFRYWTPGADPATSTSFVVDASMKTVTHTASFAASCVTVTVSTTSRDLAGGSVTSSPSPNCGGFTGRWESPYGDPTTFMGSFDAGTAVKLTAVPPTTKTTRVQDFYGWKGLPDGANDSTATTSFTIEAATGYKLGATFDTACYTDVTFGTPSGGTANLGAGDCYTPAGVAGFRAGSTVVVSTKATGTGYFQSFTGADVSKVTSTATGASGLLAISSDHLHLGAQYGVCYNAPLVVKGQYASGIETPSGNCPSQGVGWYTPGTQVHLVAKSGVFYTGVYQFSGWSGLPTEGSFEDTIAIVDASGTFSASYYNVNSCVPLNVVSEPAGAFKVTVTTDNTTGVTDTCPSGEWDTTQSFNGRGDPTTTVAHVVVTPLTAGAKSALDVVGVDTQRVDPTSSLSSNFTIKPTPTLDEYINIQGATTITASACESIAANVTLISPNGTSHTEANPGDADFVDVAPTPTCNYGQTYYTIGSPVFTQANAPADGYDFVKWSGAISSTDPDPVTPVKMDGAAQSVALTATYNVKCYTLTSNWDGVSAFPAPNCPDTDASAHSYIGGTTVALTTTGVSGQIFRNWTGPADSSSGDTAIVNVTSAKAVYAYYSTPSIGESISSAFTSVGDGLAMAAKKAVGVVSAVVTALVLNSNPVTQIISLVAAAASGISTLLHAVGVSGAGLDGFDDGLSYVTGMLNFITSVSNCATIWSYGSAAATPATSNVSSAVGSGIVKEIRVQQAAQQAAINAAYDPPSTLIPGVATSTVTKAKVTVGRLATAATVGVSIYSEIANNNSWSEDATTAWTGGGDAYLQCIDSSIPSYMGVPALPPSN